MGVMLLLHFTNEKLCDFLLTISERRLEPLTLGLEPGTETRELGGYCIALRGVRLCTCPESQPIEEDREFRHEELRQ